LGGLLSTIFGVGSGRGGGGQNRSIDPMQQGTLRLLHDGGTEDASQPLVHLAHAVSGGCRQRIQGHVVIPLDEPPVA
jgi:hypothetical protein